MTTRRTTTSSYRRRPPINNRRAGGIPPIAWLIGAGAIIAVIVLFMLLRALFGGGGCSDAYCASDQSPESPAGFERISKVFELNDDSLAESDQTIEVTLTLDGDPPEGRNLSFFSFDESTDEWTSLAAASLVDEGKSAKAEIVGAPATLAVMRRDAPAGDVVAMLPSNESTLDPIAAEHATIVMSYDLTPTAEGSIDGSVRSFPDGDYRVMPIVRADRNAEDGSLASVNNILDTPSLRSEHVVAIVDAIEASGADGVAIEYRGLSDDRETAFTLFVTELGQRLHATNLTLALILDPPALNGGQILPGAYNWQELGTVADLIVLRPHLDQRDYRVVVPDILAWLAERVPTTKIILGMTPYSTIIGSADGPQQITLYQAMSIATQMEIEGSGAGPIRTEQNYFVVGTNIDRLADLRGPEWDNSSATVAFSYQDEASGNTIYLENALSVGFKAEYIQRFQLGGLAVTDASDNPQLGSVWQGLEPFILTGQPQLASANPVTLSPMWQVEERGGELAPEARGRVRWSTPSEPGDYTITLRLGDGVEFFENRWRVSVVAADDASQDGGGSEDDSTNGAN